MQVAVLATELQNERGWKIPSGDHLLGAVSARGDCSGNVSHWIKRDSTPSLGNLLQCSVTSAIKKGVLCLERITYISVCAQMTSLFQSCGWVLSGWMGCLNWPCDWLSRTCRAAGAAGACHINTSTAMTLCGMPAVNLWEVLLITWERRACGILRKKKRQDCQSSLFS